MTLQLEILPVLALAAGIAVLVAPRAMMKFIIGGYLVIVGLIRIIQ